MQIVIDIPEEMYQKIKETSRIISGRRSGRSFDYILFNAINTGTPLPKGHGRLIDSELLDTRLDFVFNHIGGYKNTLIGTGIVIAMAENLDAKTIIEAESEEKG